MSVARVVTVAKSMKEQGACGRCGADLPKGSAYLWFKVGFRSNYKQKRCMLPACYPKPSQRESSLSTSALAAQEDFEEEMSNAPLEIGDFEELNNRVEAVHEAIQEVAGQYRDAADAWENGNADADERADIWDEAADEISDWRAENEFNGEPCDTHPEPEDRDDDCEACEAYGVAWEDLVEEASYKVQDALDGV